MNRPNPLTLVTWLTGEPQEEPVVPEPELQKLAAATVKAHSFAAEERFLTGYLTLYSGYIVANEREEAWALQLAPLWAQALEEYKTRYPRNWGELD